jgi:hypothetical protein
VCAWFDCICEFDFCHNCIEMDPIFDLVICYHGSLFGHRMEYIGGDCMEVNSLNADEFCYWDLTNILESYLGYRYNEILALYYKYDDESNEDINSLNSNQDFLKMINGIIKDGKMKLHVFVDHEEEELAEPVPIEVVAPMLFLFQTPSEVEIQYSEEDLPQHTSQPAIDEPRSDELVEQAAVQQPQQAARKSARQPRRQTAQQPWKQSVRQPLQQLERQPHDDEEADEEYLDIR